jgi:hypothetical protein
VKETKFFVVYISNHCTERNKTFKDIGIVQAGRDNNNANADERMRKPNNCPGKESNF